jgi:hypothetical protein
MTNFTIFCEIAQEEERVTPALLIPLEVYAKEIGFFDHLVHLPSNGVAIQQRER